MIKLTRNLTPALLNPAETKRLTDRYSASGESVWSAEDLKWCLLQTSNYKCAYCECRLQEESKYLEVEHFRDKHSHPSLVARWDNLLPACKRCNVHKSSHNVDAEPIINPYEIDPADHIYLKLYRLSPSTALGKSTIDVLALNDSDRLVKRRFEVGELISEQICVTRDRLDQFLCSRSTKARNKVLNTARAVLLEAQMDKPYSATAASVLCNSTEFLEIKAEMTKETIWSEELTNLLESAKALALPLSTIQRVAAGSPLRRPCQQG